MVASPVDCCDRPAALRHETGRKGSTIPPRPSSCIMPCCSALTPLAILRGICTDHNNWPTLVCRTEVAPPALQREREREKRTAHMRLNSSAQPRKGALTAECAQRPSRWMTACCSTPRPLAYYVTSAPISTKNGFTSVNIVSWSKA